MGQWKASRRSSEWETNTHAAPPARRVDHMLSTGLTGLTGTLQVDDSFRGGGRKSRWAASPTSAGRGELIPRRNAAHHLAKYLRRGRGLAVTSRWLAAGANAPK